MPRKPRSPDAATLRAATKRHIPPPSAVPISARKEVYAMFRSHAKEVLDMLVGFVRDEELDPGHRIAAGKEILNRGLGTAPNVEIVEKTLKVDVTINEDRIRQLTDAEIASTLAVLERITRGPDVEDAEVVDP